MKNEKVVVEENEDLLRKIFSIKDEKADNTGRGIEQLDLFEKLKEEIRMKRVKI